jgi:hypothetical protein
MNLKGLKIALVKQDTYQDLYVVGRDEKSALEILKSSVMRIGPLGLFTNFNSDFIIVKESLCKETQIYKSVLPEVANFSNLIKTGQFSKIPGHEFLEPGSILNNEFYATEIEEIDWGMYDIVISINVSINASVIKKYKKTLFCYMISEANMYLDYAHFGYDLTLRQAINGYINSRLGICDFPYTFLGSNTLQKLELPTNSRYGIFVEINSCLERPVIRIPKAFQIINKATNLEIKLHQQNVMRNLITLLESKYYIKYGGRVTRGNGAIEAISAGCLVIIKKSEIKYDKIVLDYLTFNNLDDLISLIIKLESDEKFYQKCLKEQAEKLDFYGFNLPMTNLISEIEKKRNSYFVYRLKRLIFINLFRIRKILKEVENAIYS